MIIHSGIVFLLQAANVSDAPKTSCHRHLVWAIVYSDCTIWKPRDVAPRKRDRGGGRNPGNQAQFKEIMTYTSAKLRGLIQLAVLGYLTHNG